MKTISFTGHRPQSLGGWDELAPLNLEVKQALKKLILDAIAQGYDHFISGTAQGVDLWALDILGEVKKEHKIKVTAAIPFIGFQTKWPEESQNHWLSSIKNYADEVFVVKENCNIIDVVKLTDKSNIVSYYDACTCLQKRNEWMVDHSDTIIGIWNEDLKGGTANCIKYAKKKNKSIVCWNPKNKETKIINR